MPAKRGPVPEGGGFSAVGLQLRFCAQMGIGAPAGQRVQAIFGKFLWWFRAEDELMSAFGVFPVGS